VPALRSKLVSHADAAARIPDDARVALGGFAVYQHPMALVRELARQGRRNLTAVGTVNGNDVDLLAGAGCLRRVETSYVGLEKYGLALNFRRRVERGELEVVDYPEVLSVDRFRASQDNLPIWGADYPHPDCLWPESRRVLEKNLSRLPARGRRKITHDNVAALYNFR
jgi:glutaconate CoA-transferase subunit A